MSPEIVPATQIEADTDIKLRHGLVIGLARAYVISRGEHVARVQTDSYPALVLDRLDNGGKVLELASYRAHGKQTHTQ